MPTYPILSQKSGQRVAIGKESGQIELRIAELFAATRDRGLTVAEITDRAFELAGRPPTRSQRLLAIRLAHRSLRRMKDTRKNAEQWIDEAHREAEAAVGCPPHPESPRAFAGYNPHCDAWRAAYARHYDAALEATDAFRRGMKLHAFVDQFGRWLRFIDMGGGRRRVEHEHWRTTIDKDGTLRFHPPDVPVRVWAVSISGRWRNLGRGRDRADH